MQIKNSVKALLMFIITFFAESINNSGFPGTKEGWIVMGVTLVGTVLIYIGKNFVFPSISIFGNIDLRDVISGLVVAIGTGVSNWVGTIIAGVPIDWASLWRLIGMVVVGYFLKNFMSKPVKDPQRV